MLFTSFLICKFRCLDYFQHCNVFLRVVKIEYLVRSFQKVKSVVNPSVQSSRKPQSMKS